MIILKPIEIKMSDNFKIANKISLVDFLKKEGYKMEETAGYFRCLSPFRNESFPSLDINKRTGKWHDRGNGKKGDIIDFIQEYKRLSKIEAVNFLLTGEGINLPIYKPIKRDSNSIEIRAVEALSNHSLWEYISKRGISKEIADFYLKEITFSFPYGKYPDKLYKAAGFKSDSGGWELRSYFFKICTANKNVTTIQGGTADNNIISVYEGFFSFLSDCERHGTPNLEHNVVVLNSLSFLPQMLSFWGNKYELYCYLDNDRAGDKAMKLIRDSGVCYKDMRSEYENHNDLNDKLTGKRLLSKRHGTLNELLNS